MLLRSKTWPAPPLMARRAPGKGLAGQWPKSHVSTLLRVAGISLRVPRRKRDTRGSFPIDISPKECGKHLWPPHKPLEWTGLALQ